jgi:hypothetical protein
MPTSAAQINTLRTGGRERCRYVGTWRPNAAGAALEPYFAGDWATVARTNVGTWALTLRPGIAAGFVAGTRRIVGWDVQLQKNAASDHRAMFGTFTPATGVLVIFTVDNAGTPTEQAANADIRLTVGIETEE